MRTERLLCIAKDWNLRERDGCEVQHSVRGSERLDVRVAPKPLGVPSQTFAPTCEESGPADGVVLLATDVSDGPATVTALVGMCELQRRRIVEPRPAHTLVSVQQSRM